MSSYVVTGASRGIGLEFVRQLGAISGNKVFALVRNKATVVHLASLEGGNIYVLQADVTDHKALKAAAAKVAEVTGGVLDVLVNNAAALNGENDCDGELLEQEFDYHFKFNAIGLIHSTNSFLPLLRKGSTKKTIIISSEGGERDFVFKANFVGMTAYGVTKTAVNMIVTKYAVQFKDEGLIFVTLSPGLVDTSATAVEQLSAKNLEYHSKGAARIRKVLPKFQGMISTEVSVAKQLKVIAEATAKDTGALLRIP